MKGRGRPSGETPRAVIEHIKAIPAPHLPPSEDPHPQFVPSPILDRLCCSICTEVALSPIQLSCDHTLCANCCCKCIQVTYTLNCPCCYRHILSSETVAPPSDLFLSLLNESVVSSVRGCSRMVKLQITDRIWIARVNCMALTMTHPLKLR